MLQLTASNRLEALADALAERIERAPLADPLAVERIVVPHSGVGRWLQLRLAERWGVAAQLRFELPAQVIGRMLALVQPTNTPPTESDDWERSAMRWRLLGLLHALPPGREWAALRRYLGKLDAVDADPLKPWQLASRLADVLDAYQVYRPDWLVAWDARRTALPESTDEAWQAALWRQLRQDLPEPDRGARLSALIAALDAGVIPQSALPTRLSLFGALPLSPLQMRWTRALAAHSDVAVFHCAPSMAYWSDLRSPREQARQRRAERRRGEPESVAHETLSPAAELLASLGSRAREAQALQIEHWLDGSLEQERWSTPDVRHPLGWLQAAILDLEDRDDAPPPDPGATPSLRVHACANARREVEVLLDALLDRLQADPSLRPHEIAIMAPSLDRYAPIIEAVLAATPHERRLPITLADRRADRIHPLTQRFLWLLRLPEVRFTRGEVISLLDCPPLRARFELSETGRDWIEAWAEALGVVCGLHAAQRDALGEGALQDHTWGAALERLLMGQAAGDDGGLLDGVAPFASGDGGEAAQALGALWALLRRLDRWRLALSEPMSPAQACAKLAELFDAFFRVEGDDEAAEDAASAIRDALADIAAQVNAVGEIAAAGLPPVMAALEEALAQPERWQRFLGEGATVCALVPLRSVPFRVVAVLGLDDGAFPRRTPPAGFDLLAQSPRPGDRRPREDDRQLLLDTLLAAREHLHLSYVGIDPVDGAARPPAPPLAEILDALRRAYADRWPAIEPLFHPRHPLATHAAANFDRPEGSFAGQWWPALRAERDGWREPPPFLRSPLAPPPGDMRVLEVERLVRFYRHPARALLTDRLGLAWAPWIEDRASEEPQAIGRREAADILTRLLAAQASGEPQEALLHRLRAEGLLPAGLVGRRALDAIRDGYAAAVALFPGQAIARIAAPANLRIGDLTLGGELGGWLCSGVPLLLGGSSPGAIELLELALLRELLRRQGLIDDAAECLYVEVPAGERPRRHRLLPLVDPDDWLAELAAGWRNGQCAPLPLPRAAGWAYATKIIRGAEHEVALAEARSLWEGSDRRRGESEDSDNAIAFRGVDLPALPAFADWAMRVHGPLAAALQTEKLR